jgi:protein gp37
MSSKSNIPWTDATWNPVVGCTHAGSPACDNCYARDGHEKRHKAYCEGKLQNTPQYAQPFEKVQLIPERLSDPLRWRKSRRIFPCSVSDIFHEAVPDSFLDRIFGTIILTCEKHTYQILTKRIDRAERYLREADREKWVYESVELTRQNFNDPTWVKAQLLKALDKNPMPYMWLGVTAENQEQFDKRVKILLQMNAAVRFVSAEPMLGRIDAALGLCQECPNCGNRSWLDLPHGERVCDDCDETFLDTLDWIICGGESGPNARPMHPDWARSLRDQCQEAGTRFYFKQWGSWMPISQMADGYCDTLYHPAPENDPEAIRRCKVENGVMQIDGTFPEFRFPEGAMMMYNIGAKKAGSLLDGKEWKQLPEVAR